jgi:hypothetical protein
VGHRRYVHRGDLCAGAARRAVLVEGKSRRAVVWEFGLARKTVNKMLENSLPPGYRRQRPVRRPRLAAWQGIIDAILREDKQRPRKQRHTDTQDIIGSPDMRRVGFRPPQPGEAERATEARVG